MRPTGAVLATMRAAWRSFDTAEKRKCVAVIAIAGVAACLTLVSVAGVAPFLAAFAEPELVAGHRAVRVLEAVFGRMSEERVRYVLAAAFVVVFVLANAANLLSVVAINRFAHRVGARFHTSLFEEYLHRDLRFHAAAHSEALATDVVHEVNRTVNGVIQGSLTLLASSLSVVLIAGAAVVVNPAIALTACATLGSIYAVVYVLVRARLARDGAAISALWRHRAKVVGESFESIADVTMHRAQRLMAEAVARQSQAIADAQVRIVTTAASPRYVLESAAAAGMVIAALWLYRSAGAGPWLTQLAFFGLAAYRLLPPVQQLFSGVARIRAEGAGFMFIAAQLAQRTALLHREHAAPLYTAAEIRLIDVSYRHAGGRGGIEGVSLLLPRGALIGIVGPNGSGKTTLANLMLGLLAPDTGRMEIDGVPLDVASRPAWLASVAHVPQKVFLLDDSIVRNVAFGVADHEIDLERVRAAVRDVGLTAVVASLPNELETVIGQDGAVLSGGQRQRLGIARALYRRPAFLVLDEATSALDSAGEADVVQLLDRLRGACTIVLITHRQALLRRCDVVFELDAGRLVKQWSPASVGAGNRHAGAA